MDRPQRLNKPTAPCKDCADRNPDCHGICEAYKNFVTEKDKYNKQERDSHIYRNKTDWYKTTSYGHWRSNK